MQYWEEMDDKYGFSDGNCYPVGIETYRDIYVKAVSRLAEKLGSKYRVVPYDRFGVHNYCFWYFVSKDWFEKVYLPKQEEGQPWSTTCSDDCEAARDDFSVTADEAMMEAIYQAGELGIDNYVEVEVKRSPAFEEFLKTCHQELVDTQAA